MSIINYDSPDFQRMIQRAMANPLNRSNPNAIMRRAQKQYTDDVMDRRLRINSSLLDKAAKESDIAHKNRLLDFSSQELGLKSQGLDLDFAQQAQQFEGNKISERFREGRLGLDVSEMKDKEDDLDSLWPLLPIAVNAYTGYSRGKKEDALYDKQMAAADAMRQHYGGKPTTEPQLQHIPASEFGQPKKARGLKNLFGLVN